MTRILLTAALAFTCLWTSFAAADDWPEYRGPNREGIWREQGVIQEWPPGGPKEKWRVDASYGYAGPSVADGKVYLFDYVIEDGDISNNPGSANALQGSERLRCLDAETGDVLWTHQYEAPYSISYAAGPRCTPTVEGDSVYTLGAEGELRRIRTSDGELVWRVSFKDDLAAKTPIWGHSSHPLVDDTHVYCMVGGEGVGAAFDKDSGDVVWRALAAPEPGYCPPTMIQAGGARQLIMFTPEGVNSLNPATGDVHWSVPMRPSSGMSIAPPQKRGDRLFVSAYGNVSAMLVLSNSEAEVTDQLWRGTPKDSVHSSNSTPFFDSEAIYGCSVEDSLFIAVNPEDGQRFWESYKPTTGETPRRRVRHATTFIVKHEPSGLFWLFDEAGELILAELSPEGYREIGRAKLLEPTNEAFGRPVVWSHPAFAERSIFARNDKEIVCVSLEE